MHKTEKSSLTSTYICCSLIVLAHGVALAIYLIPAYHSFSAWFPATILISLVLVILDQPDKSRRFWRFILMCFIASLLLEFFGVISGIIFGGYTFGTALGPKVADVPLLMPAYWVLLFYTTAALFKNFGIRSHTLRALSGAVFLVFLDVLIEPIAIKFNYWNWLDMNVPLQRYLALFIISFIVLRLLYHSKFNKRNTAATVFILIHSLFYTALNLWAF